MGEDKAHELGAVVLKRNDKEKIEVLNEGILFCFVFHLYNQMYQMWQSGIHDVLSSFWTFHFIVLSLPLLLQGRMCYLLLAAVACSLGCFLSLFTPLHMLLFVECHHHPSWRRVHLKRSELRLMTLCFILESLPKSGGDIVAPSFSFVNRNRKCEAISLDLGAKNLAGYQAHNAMYNFLCMCVYYSD